jgi:integrase
MEKHLEEYLNEVRRVGLDDMYVKNLGYRLNILIRECRWAYPAKVTADSFTAWRAKQSKAAKTLNQYLDSANVLLNWMIKKKRISENPLVTVDKVAFVPAFERRGYSDDEMKRLLAVAGESRIGYLFAYYTGLRRAELKAMRQENLHLDAEVPHLILSGKFTKNKKDAKIPLHPQLVEELRRCTPAGARPSDPVFTGKMLPSIWKVKCDLKKAGIPYEENGRRADLHSLRHTLATNLARLNVPPRVAMQILRHSDIRLTMINYTDETLATYRRSN